MYRLCARAGCGSVLVETQSAWYGLKYRLAAFGDLFKEPQASWRQSTRSRKSPTLILPDGAVMTAAITLLLADMTGRDDLALDAAAPERARFLRLLIFMVTNIYPTFTYAHDPARFVGGEVGRSTLRSNAGAYAKRLWGILEAAAAAPWFLGDRFSATSSSPP